MSTSNPAFSQDIFAGYEQVYGKPRSMAMTVQGTVGKTFLLLAILSATALWSWNAMADGRLAGGALLASAGRLHLRDDHDLPAHGFSLDCSHLSALEGVFLGAVSQVVETTTHLKHPEYGGIALQAVSLTCGVLFVMLFLYGSRIIRVTDRLRMGIIMATGAFASSI